MKSQKEKLFELLSDGLPHRTDEIMKVVYGDDHLGLARVGARILDIKNAGHKIEGWKDKIKPALYWYQMEIKEPEQSSMFGTPKPIKEKKINNWEY